MEGYQERTARIRERLRGTLDKEFDALESLFNAELVEKRETWIRESTRNDVKLEEKDDMIEVLESENKSLKADLNTAKARNVDQQAFLDGHAHETLKAQLEACKRDYAKVAKARNLLETKCRRYKEMQREWREYVKTWVGKGHEQAVAQEPAKRVLPSLQPGRPSPSQPAPPMVPDITTPRSFRDGSPSVSPRVTLLDRPDLDQQYHRERKETSSRRDRRSLHAENVMLGRYDNLNANETTEASSDNGSRPITADEPKRAEGGQASLLGHAISWPVTEDEDSPVVVSERSLKRKRPPVKQEAGITIHEDGNVKGEPGLSSPVVTTSSRPTFGIQDSLDLDDVGRSVDTPRKGRRFEQIRLMSALDDAAWIQNSTCHLASPQQPEEHMLDGPPTQDEFNLLMHRTQTSLKGQFSANSEVQAALTAEEQERLRRKAVSAAEQNALNQRINKRRSAPLLGSPRRAHTSDQLSTPHGNRRREQRSAEPQDPVILRPKDLNALPRTSTEKSRPYAPSRRDRGAAHVQALAEDGEDATPSKRYKPSSRRLRTFKQNQEGQSGAAEKNDSSSPHYRLGALLQDPSPDKAALIQPRPDLASNKASVQSETPSVPSKHVPVTRTNKTPMTAPVKKSTSLHRPGTKSVTTKSRNTAKHSLFARPSDTNNPPEVLPEHEPLRVRSVDRLRLTDFKLNKNHSEFAFHESIRKHDEKKKLGGCTDPFCQRCSEIARFAELTNFVAPEKHGLLDSSPQGAEHAEQRLLEDFLGDDERRLRRLSPDERNELLKKAREKSFADLYGKHRQAHPRAVSPPGYWETEFPSTQQETENREAAKAIDKQRIRERYNEALRGGVWKFADE